ncbi:MAG: YitT family protein [Clostridiales bacterium]|jgi:uncharacterized membrane-anchored protein YitT (DUF2179 family)|nr:YitT family protein [Clostridiales bacterium]
MSRKLALKQYADYIIILAGTFVLACAIRFFYTPNTIVTGGVTGLSIITYVLSGKYLNFAVPLWVTNIVLNVPLFIASAKFNGKSFMIKSFIATLFLSFSLYVLEMIQAEPLDFVISSVFGGALSGIGLGLVFSRGGSTGGADLAVSIIRYFFRHISISKIFLALEIIIITAGFFIFGAEKAMYAIIAVFVSSKMVDAILEGVHFAKAAFIISDRADEISARILAQLSRGVTELSGRGVYSGSEKRVMLCVVSRKEIVTLKDITASADKSAFVIVADVREVLGKGFIEL